MQDFKVVNVVASTKLDREIDLERLSIDLKGAVYDPQIWSGMVWRRSNPKSTIIMFANGKITSVGTQSEEEAEVAIEKAVQAIPQLSDAHYSKPAIVNIVAVADLHKEIDLELLHGRLNGTLWEPEQFPGLVYKTPAVTFLVFRSGKIALVGGKSEKQVKEELMELIRKSALDFRSIN
jgi:transcription initiation factor TFIID TATA-box-binding protein